MQGWSKEILAKAIGGAGGGGIVGLYLSSKDLRDEWHHWQGAKSESETKLWDRESENRI